jgi:hypothetical protein
MRKKFKNQQKETNMTNVAKSENYFVIVDKEDGSTDRWEMLTKDQANYVYAEQVEIYGMPATTTGQLEG